MLKGQYFTLSGEVIDTLGHPISPLQIAVDDLPFKTQMAGSFELHLPQRPHKITVKAPGFVPKIIVLPYNYSEQQTIVLEAARVNTNLKPHEIIRRVQVHIDSLKNNCTTYKTNIYKINKAYITKIPFEIEPVSGVLIPDRQDTGLVYLSEEYQQAIYVDHKNYREETLGKRASGRLPLQDWNHLPDYDLSLYNPKLYMREVFSRGFYSPFSEQALRYYNFKLEADYDQGTEHIFMIRFWPRKEKFPVYSGTLQITDNGYKVLAADFNISSNNQLELFDSVHVHQEYDNNTPNYHLKAQKVSYFITLARFSGSYHTEQYFNNFKFASAEDLTPVLPLHYHGSIDTADYHRDENFWDSLRLRPLTKREQLYLTKHDIANYFMGNYALKDSLPFLDHQFKPLPFVATGFKYGTKKVYLDWEPFWYALGYNTVEGPYLRYNTPIQFLCTNSTITLNPELRYGFTDNRLKYQLQANYFYDLLKPKRIGFSGGHIVSQFNENTPILPIINTFYTLGLGNNYLKLYQKDFIEINHDWEPVNGLTLTTSVEFSERTPVYNTTYFTILKSLENFTPNNPTFSYADIDSNGFNIHNALTLEAGFNYTFNQPYRIEFGKKKIIEARSPMLYMNVRAGIPTVVSSTNYLFMNVGFRWSTMVWNTGRSSIDVNFGGFPIKENIPFMDYRHFDGVQTLFLQAPPSRMADIRQFSTLPYYDFSTTNNYLELHYEHQFDGSLMAHINFLRKLKVHSFTGINYLTVGDGAQFSEFFLGFDNIFGALRLEFAGGLDSFKELHPTLRVGLDLDYTYYRDHRRR